MRDFLYVCGMKNLNHQKLTGEWHKHFRKRYRKAANRKRRTLFKKDMIDQLKELK